MRHLPYQLVQDFSINSMIMIFFQDLWHFIANEVASLAADSALWSLSRFELLSSGSAAREMAVRFMALFRSVDCFIQSHYKQIHGFLPSGNDVYLGTLSISNPSKNGGLPNHKSLGGGFFSNENQASWQLTLLDDTANDIWTILVYLAPDSALSPTWRTRAVCAAGSPHTAACWAGAPLALPRLRVRSGGKGFSCGLAVLVVEHAAEIFAQLPFQLIEALFLQTTGQESWGRPFCIQCVGDKVKKAIKTDPARLFTVQENAQTTAEVRILQKTSGLCVDQFFIWRI